MNKHILRFFVSLAIWANLWATLDEQNWYAAAMIIVLMGSWAFQTQAEDQRDLLLAVLAAERPLDIKDTP